MRSLRLLAAGLLLGLSAFGAAIVGPAATVQIDGGDPTSIPLLLREIPTLPGVIAFESDPQFGDGSVRLSGQYKADPFLDLTISITDFGTPTTYLITLASVVAGGPYGLLTTNFDGTPPVDRLVSVDGATLQAGVNDGGPLVYDPALQLTIPTCNAISGCGPVGPASVSGVFNPTLMYLQMSFTGPGNGHAFSFHGRLDVEPGDGAVPEPASFGLMAAGLVSLAWLRRRRDR